MHGVRRRHAIPERLVVLECVGLCDRSLFDSFCPACSDCSLSSFVVAPCSAHSDSVCGSEPCVLCNFWRLPVDLVVVACAASCIQCSGPSNSSCTACASQTICQPVDAFRARPCRVFLANSRKRAPPPLMLLASVIAIVLCRSNCRRCCCCCFCSLQTVLFELRGRLFVLGVQPSVPAQRRHLHQLPQRPVLQQRAMRAMQHAYMQL